MYVARILYPVEVLGPGKRVGIWFCGCPRRCKGCSNPELWVFCGQFKTTPQLIYELIVRIAKEHAIDGFTITGGEPMYQPKELHQLISLIKVIADDILVYTGYSINELTAEKLQGISVLIDGEYIENRNMNCVLRGSDNQTIHILDRKYEKEYSSYLSQSTNQIQNFMTSDGVISVGIHKPNFMDALNTAVLRKGLKDNG
jgi:anaerobic ribonucleoside-triphosphate reductase activating protein